MLELSNHRCQDGSLIGIQCVVQQMDDTGMQQVLSLTVQP